MLKLQSVLVLIVLVVVARTTVNAEFPDDPKPCKYGDGTCIAKVIGHFMKEKSRGDASINLVTIDPLQLDEVRIKQGAENPVNIDLTFIKNSLIGLSTVNAIKVKGFGKDLTEKHSIRMKVDGVHFVGDYKIDGKILLLPIRGMGKNNITLENVQLTMHFNGIPIEKDGATYMKVDKLKMDVEPGRMIYRIDNLFNGDKVLGDNMNLFLNENWKEIYGEVRTSIETSFSRIFGKVINDVFSKYPYEKFFTE